MNILFLDIEKTPPHVATYELYNTTVPLYHVIQDSFVPSISWAWNEHGEAQNVNVMHDVKRFINDHTDDYHVIKTIHGEIEKADVIVGHYVKGFDWKVITGLFVLHKLPPIEKKLCVDTLAEAKKYKFLSNKLDHLAEKFELDRKIEHRKEMMLKCSQGDVEALRECAAYNNGDIYPMRSLFYIFRPYSHTNQYPDMQKVNGEFCCKKCGSVHLQKRGFDMYGLQIYGCYDCRARFKSKVKK
jgi:hypothetical protein